MRKFNQPINTYKMKKQLFESDHDDLKWWEVPFVLLFVLALYVLVNVVDWFQNPIKRGVFTSFVIGFILTVLLLYVSCRLIWG